MSTLLVIIIGFVVGLLAQVIMPGKDSAGFILTTVLGIVGAFVGKLLGQGMGLYTATEPAGLIMSVLGAFLVLFAFKMLFRNSVAAKS